MAITRRTILVVLPAFVAYASLFALQRRVKEHLGLQDDNSKLSYRFGRAVALLYWLNLVCRFGHELFARWVSSKFRIYVGLSSLAVSEIILMIMTFGPRTTANPWTYINVVGIAYTLGGIGIGTFEPNIVNFITPYGKQTQGWASFGIPGGVACVTIIGFFLLRIGVPLWCLYAGVIIMLMAATAILTTLETKDRQLGSEVRPLLPEHAKDTGDQSTPLIFTVPLVIRYLCLTVDMFGVSMFSPGVILYVEDQKTINILGFAMKNSTYFTVYGIGTSLGGIVGRLVGHWVTKVLHPCIPLSFLVAGVLVNIVLTPDIPIFGFLGAFLVLFGNGFLYNQCWRYFDNHCNESSRLRVISLWLGFGDCGSVSGSMLITAMRGKLTG